MRMIIEARIDDGVGGGVAIRLAEFGRLDGDLKQLGPNLTEGRSLVHEAQRAFVCAQTRVVVSASLNCPQCGRKLSIKATHAIRYRTVFGKVTIDSPQLRVSPELEYLQVKWAAHLPYAVATALLKETLPVDQAISTAGLRNRVWAVGQELDDKAESAIRGERAYPPANSECKIVALAVDSAWLRHRPSREEKTKPSFRSISLRSGRRPQGDT